MLADFDGGVARASDGHDKMISCFHATPIVIFVLSILLLLATAIFSDRCAFQAACPECKHDSWVVSGYVSFDFGGLANFLLLKKLSS